MRSWSDLPDHLLILIFRKLRLVQDICTLQMVCKFWQFAYKQEETLDESWPKVPVLMLAEKEGSDEREFFSLYMNKNWKVVSYLPEAKQSRCLESLGWLITISEPSGDMNLLHPFTRVRIPLPSQKTIENYDRYMTRPYSYFVEKAVLSASPSETSDYIVMVIHSGCHSLGFWKNGDKKWTSTEYIKYNSITDVIYYKGKFYTVSLSGHIWVWDISGANPTTDDFQQVAHIDSREFATTNPYLVESSGELLVITRDGIDVDDEYNYGAENFRVFKVDLIEKRLEEIKNIGERAIFIGMNSSFSVEVNRFPTSILKPNCIYFTDDSLCAFHLNKQGGGKDMGIYHLEDKRIEHFDNVQSFSHISPPIWIRPSVHTIMKDNV